MTRLVPTALFAAVAVSATLAPAAIEARTAAPFYTVELAQPASDDEAIAGGVLFRCEGTTCTAPRSRDRDRGCIRRSWMFFGQLGAIRRVCRCRDCAS